jgi:hypothetical protein
VGRDGNTNSDWTTDKQLAFYRQLMGIARQREYKPGWAKHKFREKFGEFPLFTGKRPACA